MKSLKWMVPLLLLLGVVWWVVAQGHPKGRVFLTFDDGPINATHDVLDVLKAAGVKATFFINSYHLEGPQGSPVDRADDALRRIIAEGHVLANHSHDHMLHSNTPFDPQRIVVDTYGEPEQELPYFGARVVGPVRQVLGELYQAQNNRLNYMVRLPYSNNWRLPDLVIDCPCCTLDEINPQMIVSPTGSCKRMSQSAHNAVRLADHFAENHMEVFGWDVDWGPTDWTAARVSETLQGVEALVAQIEAVLDGDACATDDYLITVPCQAPPRDGKVIVLTHDFLFEDGYRGRGKQVNLPKLARLIETLRARGHRLDTLDRYLE